MTASGGTMSKWVPVRGKEVVVWEAATIWSTQGGTEARNSTEMTSIACYLMMKITTAPANGKSDPSATLTIARVLARARPIATDQANTDVAIIEKTESLDAVVTVARETISPPTTDGEAVLCLCHAPPPTSNDRQYSSRLRPSQTGQFVKLPLCIRFNHHNLGLSRLSRPERRPIHFHTPLRRFASLRWFTVSGNRGPTRMVPARLLRIFQRGQVAKP